MRMNKYRSMVKYQPAHFNLLESVEKTPSDCVLVLSHLLQEDNDPLSIDLVIQAFKSIPPFVTHLDFSRNQLLFKDVKSIHALISAIPPSITYLDLSWNAYKNSPPREFDEQSINLLLLLTMLSFKKNLKVLDLRHNWFNTLFRTDELRCVRLLRLFVDELYLSSDEIIGLSKEQLDFFAKILPVSQDVYCIDERERLVTSNKIHYLTRQLVLADTRRHLQGLALLDKKALFPRDITLDVMSHLLPRTDIQFCAERLKISPYDGYFFKPSPYVSHKRIRISDNYFLSLVFYELALLGGCVLSWNAPSIAKTAFLLLVINFVLAKLDNTFHFSVFKNTNFPIDMGCCSVGGRSSGDLCIRFNNEMIGEEPKTSFLFK